MVEITFEAVTERDMDFLIMEEISCSQDFANIFLTKVGKENAKLISSAHSRRRKYYGESDLVFVFEYNGKRHAILIEDKIDAPAMDNQSGRYFKRGEKSVKEGEFDTFDVFIVAPKGYLKTNVEANLYPNRVSYEELEHYFESREDMHSRFKLMMIWKALGRQKDRYKPVQDDDMMAFWDGYLNLHRQKCPELIITNADGIKGGASHWVNYRSPIKNTILRHKGPQGMIDLEFKRMADQRHVLDNMLAEVGRNGTDVSDVKVESASKSGVLRIYVPTLDFLGSYMRQEEQVIECLDAVKKLYSIAEIIQRNALI